MATFLTILVVVFLTIFGAGYLTGTAVARHRFRWEQQRAFSAAEVFGQGYRAGAADAGRADPAQGPPSPDAVLVPTTGPTTRSTIAPGPPPAAGSEPGPTQAFATSVPASFPAEPEPTPEGRAAHKATRDLRNINIALYSASLLLIAAGGLFIGTAVPGVARAVTICAVVALFYVAGLVTHARLPRLRPAAVAFAGTGLALLPLAGLLLGILTGEGRLAWFVTAVIGSVAYVLAAVLLQSRVVANLALPFFLSIALSSVSLLGGALVWYFTCSIAVAALFAVTLRLRPRWLPAVVARAIIDTHRLLAPIALAASLILGARLPEGDRALLWVVAAAYYAALLVILAEWRSQHFYAARLIGSVAVLFVALASGVSWPWALFILSLAGAVQVIALLAVGTRVFAFLRWAERPATIRPEAGQSVASAGAARTPSEMFRVDVLATFGATIAVGGFVAVSGPDAAGWAGEHAALQAFSPEGPDPVLPMLLVPALGMAAAVRCRGNFEFLLVPGILLSAVTSWEYPWRTELVLGLSLAYLVTRAVRASADGRELFTLAARATGAALIPCAILVHLRPAARAGDPVLDLAVLALVVYLAANQAVEVVRVAQGRSSTYSTVIVCGVSAAALLAAVMLALGANEPLIGVTGLWVCAAVGTGTSLTLSRRTDIGGHGTTAPGGATGVRRRPSAVPAMLIEAIAPVSLLAVALGGIGADFGPRSYEVLLVITVAYSALMARSRAGTRGRGAYLLAAQLSFTVLTAVISADLDLSVHQVLTVVACTITAQEAVRILLRHRLRDVGLQSSSTCFSIGVLTALPFAYLVLSAPDARLSVLSVHLVLLGLLSGTLFAVQRKDYAAYPAIYALGALIAVLAGAIRTESGIGGGDSLAAPDRPHGCGAGRCPHRCRRARADAFHCRTPALSVVGGRRRLCRRGGDVRVLRR